MDRHRSFFSLSHVTGVLLPRGWRPARPSFPFRSLPLILITFIGAMLISGAARRAAAAEPEIWFCNYIAGPKSAELAIRSRFEVQGLALLETSLEPVDFDFDARYLVLQNTSDAIIAAVSNAKLDPEPATAVMGAFVVVIDKRTGAFELAGIAPGHDISDQHGRCNR